MQLHCTNMLDEPVGRMIAKALRDQLEEIEEIRGAVTFQLDLMPPIQSSRIDEQLQVRPKFTMFFSLRNTRKEYCDIPRVHTNVLAGAFYQHPDGRCSVSIDWPRYYDSISAVYGEAGLKSMLETYAQAILRIITDDTSPTMQ